MLRRIVAITLLVLLVTLLLAVSGLYWLAGTEAGGRYALNRALPYVPGKLEIGSIHGTLWAGLQLGDVHYALDKQSLAMQHFSFAWQPAALLYGLIDIPELTANGVQIRYDAEEAEEESAPLHISLPLRVQVESVLLQDVSISDADTTQHIQRLSFGAYADAQDIRLQRLQLQMDPVELQLEASAALPDLRNIKAELQWRYRDKEYGDISGSGRLQGDLKRLQVESSLLTPFQITAHGPVFLDKEMPEFDLQGRWQTLRWPLQGKAEYFSERGTFRLSGTTAAYKAEIKGSVRDTHSGPLQLLLNARGDDAQLLLDVLRLEGKPGKLQTKGTVGWQEGISFALAVDAEQLQVQPWLPDWPGSLNAQLDAKGRIDGDKLTRAALDIQRLDGKLRGYPLAASGYISSEGQRLTLKQVHVSSGNNRIEVDGSIDEKSQSQLDFKLNAPQLAGLWPGLHGALTGSGRVGGNFEQPSVDAELQGRNIAYQNLTLRRLNAQLDIDTQSGGRVDTLIAVEDMLLGENRFSALRISSAGTLPSHILTLAMNGEPGTLQTKLQGGYRDKRWSGAMTALDLRSRTVGNWSLEQQAPLSAAFGAAVGVRISDFCLYRQHGRLCADGSYQGDKGYRLSGNLQNVPLALLHAYLPENLRIDGSVGGPFEVEEARGVFRASAAIDAQPGVITLTDSNNVSKRFNYDTAFVHASSKDAVVDVDYALHIRDSGRLNGKLRIDAERRLDGRLQARWQDLTLFAATLSDVENVTGLLTADVHIAGTLQQPAISGELLLAGGRASVRGLGVELQGIRLRAVSRDERTLVIDGEIHSGPGKVTLNGNLLLDAARNWPLRLAIRGEQFQAALLPEAEVFVAPDLLLQSAGTEAKLSGTVLIPEAHMRLKQLPKTAVSVSPDQIIEGGKTGVTSNKAVEQREVKSPLAMQVAVKLGEKVDFEGYGLKTELLGAIDVSSDKGKTAAYGEVKMQSGKYQAYGQDLTIERGRFIFTGSASNPNLDIRAVRVSKTDQVKAILTVSGPLRAPLTKVSSEPPLPQDQALAYLVTGRPLDRADSSQRDMLAQAALSYGLSQTQPYLQRLGIDEASIEDSGTLTGSSLLLGKYLTPELYIGTVSNIFTGAAAIVLRYRLSKRFSVETHTGTSHGVDFLYNLEVD